jgi:predicted RNase H-like HicB family nuclease
MQQYDIEELMALDWTIEVCKDKNGDFVLTVERLNDFAVYGSTLGEVVEQLDDAIRSHLEGYLAAGKIVPIPPPARIVLEERDTRGASVEHIGFDALTGRTRRSVAA